VEIMGTNCCYWEFELPHGACSNPTYIDEITPCSRSSPRHRERAAVKGRLARPRRSRDVSSSFHEHLNRGHAVAFCRVMEGRPTGFTRRSRIGTSV
jgi:hypothetical protein